MDYWGANLSGQTIGFGTLDSVNGLIRNEKMKNESWDVPSGTQSKFSKSNFKSGSIHTYRVPLTTVADKFTYRFVVTHKGYTYLYGNYTPADADVKNNDFNNTKPEYYDDYARYIQEAGSYNDLRKDTSLGGQIHHIVSKDALTAYDFNSDYAPCIRMTNKDHRKTPNWGKVTEHIEFRKKEKEYLSKKEYANLIKMEIDELKKIKTDDKKTTLYKRYNESIIKAVQLLNAYFGI